MSAAPAAPASTTVPGSAEANALAAVDAIIDNFRSHRKAAYFAGFAEDATFLFHTTPHRIDGRAGYEALWTEWETNDGFRVHDATSTNRRIQVFGSTAVFSHDVETTLETNGDILTVNERESIILERSDDAWLCVHEHLSIASPDMIETEK
ncbi:nuclear transport factor 2 family protein [Cryobacterium psychrophilum]|uniref:DUF4440 domain-containing protein n=1 Tax=Cryobacterium psychrophilum TaxID=41988 RepID=A0A4Y8KQQ0_9MICO|nr:nuclear transport factor 2 family protein [Cryobacterium psychrophilum]TDW29408.1 ketosteroid isomerase-like protein [Cryobacterium psychrophilum]TFD81449.1 DUF4440 domain-containing protein [Cryobacterium psychrophilum]